MLLLFTPLVAVDGVFLAAAGAGLAPLVAGDDAAGFFSATLVLVVAGAAGFLAGAVVGVVFLTAAVVFLASPLVWGLDTPLDRRLWDVLGREPVVVLLGVLLPGFVLAAVLLGVLVLESPEVLLGVLVAGLSLAWSGLASGASPPGCCVSPSSAGLAAWSWSCPAAGGPSLAVSIGSIAAVVTPSGFISTGALVVRLYGARIFLEDGETRSEERQREREDTRLVHSKTRHDERLCLSIGRKSLRNAGGQMKR